MKWSYATKNGYVGNSIKFYSPSVSFELESLIPQYLDQFRLINPILSFICFSFSNFVPQESVCEKT